MYTTVRVLNSICLRCSNFFTWNNLRSMLNQFSIIKNLRIHYIGVNCNKMTRRIFNKLWTFYCASSLSHINHLFLIGMSISWFIKNLLSLNSRLLFDNLLALLRSTFDNGINLSILRLYKIQWNLNRSSYNLDLPVLILCYFCHTHLLIYWSI